MKITEEKTNIRIIDRVALFLLGMINGCPYMIGMASAQRIARNYAKPQYLGLVTGFNTASGVFGRFLNTWLTSFNFPYEIRFLINSAAMVIGLVGCAFSISFWITLCCVFFLGFTSGFGGAFFLSYIPYRRKNPLLKAYSSGTGMSGIIGAGYSVLCSYLKFDYFWSFIAVAPIVIVYIILFFVIVKKSPDEPPERSATESLASTELDPDPLLSNKKSSGSDDEIVPPAEIAPPTVRRIGLFDCTVLKPIWHLVLYVGLVYFFEFVIQSCFTDCGLTHDQHEKYPYMYSLCNFIYQTGIFISRSSLSLFQFPWVGTLTLVQYLFFIAWFFQPFFNYMPIWLMVAWMLFVGIVGGLSFINIFHLILKCDKLDSRQKEMATSWTNFIISVFTVLSSVFTLVAENTFFKDMVHK